MKNIFLTTIALISILLFSGCTKNVSTPKVQKKQTELREDIRIFSVDNKDGKITAKSI